MQKLGEIVGLGASKAKLIAGQVPDSAMGLRTELSATRIGQVQKVAPDDYRAFDLGGEVTLTNRAGKVLFTTLRNQNHTVAEVAVWYRDTMNRLSDMIDRSETLAK